KMASSVTYAYTPFFNLDSPGGHAIKQSLLNSVGGLALDFWAMIGDSVCAGVGSSPGGTQDSLYSLGWPARMAAKMTGRGYPTKGNGSLGTGNQAGATSFPIYDPRWKAYTGAWAANASNQSFGGDTHSSNTTAGVAEFDVGVACDTADVF